jgi:hypothetical protein
MHNRIPKNHLSHTVIASGGVFGPFQQLGYGTPVRFVPLGMFSKEDLSCGELEGNEIRI